MYPKFNQFIENLKKQSDKSKEDELLLKELLEIQKSLPSITKFTNFSLKKAGSECPTCGRKLP
jgi:DNA repair exonuclease SbcCD ATPase subunit